MRKLTLLAIFFTILFIWGCDEKNPIKSKTREGAPPSVNLPSQHQWLWKIINEPLEQFQDLRYADVSKLNLIDDYEILKTVTFSSFTKWPLYANLPEQFDPVTVMEWGKTPGLNIKSLQAKGYEGNGINVAIIDQKLLQDHSEYSAQVISYKEFPTLPYGPQMHGAAVASLLVGKTCGILPKADLYYYAVHCGDYTDYKYYSQALEDIIDLNNTTLIDNPIKAVSVSMGFQPQFPNLDMWKSSLQKAEEAGILVFHTSFYWLKDRYYLYGAGCIPYEDKNNPEHYDICYFARGYQLSSTSEYLFIPCDNRTSADFILDNCYDFWGMGGLSWSMPYIAGVAALGRQIKPGLSNDEIVTLLYETGTPFKNGKLINPEGFINAISKNN